MQFVALALLLIASSADALGAEHVCAPGPKLVPIVTIAKGIRYRSIDIHCRDDAAGGPKTDTTLHLVNVDLGERGLSIQVSAPQVRDQSGSGSTFKVALPTSVFASSQAKETEPAAVAQLAINASFFTACCTDAIPPTARPSARDAGLEEAECLSEPAGADTRVRGLQMTGSLVNTRVGANLCPQSIPLSDFLSSLLIRGPTAEIWTATSVGDAPPFGVVSAVTGSHRLIKDKQVVAPHCLHKGSDRCKSHPWLGLNARTAVGLQDASSLVMAVVDGADGGSGGVTLFQLADILSQFQVAAAINLDGGGSSTMARRSEATANGFAVLNRLSDRSLPDGGTCTVPTGATTNCERYVGVTLSVAAPGRTADGD